MLVTLVPTDILLSEEDHGLDILVLTVLVLGMVSEDPN
jgi:hypothetical protein